MKAVALGALGMLIASNAFGAERQVDYVNPRFGYAVLVPSWMIAQPPSENGDGQAYRSPDGTVTIVVSGRYIETTNDLADTLDEELKFAAQDGIKVSYKTGSAKSFTFSGTAKDKVLYVHAVLACRGTAAAFVRLEYPVAAKGKIDPLIPLIAHSLHATEGCA